MEVRALKAWVGIVAGWVLLAPFGGRAAEIRVEPNELVVGHPATAWVVAEEEAGFYAPIEITYRPGTQIAFSEALQPSAVVDLPPSWTPKVPGLVRLSTALSDQPLQRDLSVRYSRTPWSGVLVLSFAGLLLFGGVALGLQETGRS